MSLVNRLRNTILLGTVIVVCSCCAGSADPNAGKTERQKDQGEVQEHMDQALKICKDGVEYLAFSLSGEYSDRRVKGTHGAIVIPHAKPEGGNYTCGGTANASASQPQH